MSSGAQQTSAVSSDVDHQMTEWTTARSTLQALDSSLQTLRQYGFTLVTGLLAITGFLSTSPSTQLSDGVKFGIVVAIEGLIVTLSFLDQQLRYLEKGAAVRARILERCLNLDLTSSISRLLRIGRFGGRYTLIYIGFCTSAAFLGAAVLWGHSEFAIPLIAVYFFAVWLVCYLDASALASAMDWSLDNKVVSEGTPVRITYTNLMSEPGVELGLYCSVTPQAGGEPAPLRYTSVYLQNWNQRDWVWNSKGFAPGLYFVDCYWLAKGGSGFSSRTKPLRSYRVVRSKKSSDVAWMGFPVDVRLSKAGVRQLIDQSRSVEVDSALLYPPPDAPGKELDSSKPKVWWARYRLVVQVAPQAMPSDSQSSSSVIVVPPLSKPRIREARQG